MFMKKLWLLVGVGLGFILGSKAGREPYERIEEKVREVSGRPEVKHAVHVVTERSEDVADTVLQVASDKVDDVTGKVQAKAKALAK
jgi:hypothetical protein